MLHLQKRPHQWDLNWCCVAFGFTKVEDMLSNFVEAMEVGIKRHKTTTYSSQQNGVVECMNGTLVERERIMLSYIKLQQELWTIEFTTTFYMVNQSPLVAIEYKILEEIWTCHFCDYLNTKKIGFDAYAIICKDQHSKLDPRSNKYIFVGYVDRVKG
jgi:hypothetical protein